MRRWLRMIPRPLAILLVLTTIEGLAWVSLSPATQGPDETAHWGYVAQLAETGHRPSATSGDRANSDEISTALTIFGLQPLLGNSAARPSWGAAERTEWRAFAARVTKQQRSNAHGANAQAANPPLYYALQALPYRLGLALGGDFFARTAIVRLGNLPMLLLGIVFVWLLAAEVFATRHPWLPTIATAAVALHPKLTSLSGTIDTEPLLFMCFSAAIWLGVRLVSRGPSLPATLGLAAAVTAGALTHGRGLALVPAGLVAFGIAVFAHRPSARRVLMQASGFLAVLLVGVAVLKLTTGAANTGSAYGGEVSRSTGGGGRHFEIAQFLSQTWQFYFPRLAFMHPALGPPYGYRQVYIETFFSGLYAYDVGFLKGNNDLLQFLIAGGLIALASAIAVKWRRLAGSLPVLLTLIAFFGSEVALLHLTSYNQLLVGNDPIITGRYLVPPLAIFGVAIAFVVGAQPRRVGAIVGGTVVGAGVVLQLTLLGMTIARFYG